MGSFILIGGLVIGSVFQTEAHAVPGLGFPEVSAGTVPYRHYSGELCEAATDVLTVPDGQEFLVTMVVTNTDGGASHGGEWSEHHGAMLLRDGVIALAGSAIGKKSTLPVASGTGRLPVSAGSTLSIKTVSTGGACYTFYLQGYFIEAGSPYRSFYGNSGLGRDVITVESGRQFLVRTLALHSREWPNYCHVWIDGVRIIHGDTWAVTDRNFWGGGRAGGFADGKGALVLTEGVTLQVGPVDPTLESQCDYYMAGEYIDR